MVYEKYERNGSHELINFRHQDDRWFYSISMLTIKHIKNV